jgi:hypothetical protein
MVCEVCVRSRTASTGYGSEVCVRSRTASTGYGM